jgi:hypothetical protein
MSRHSYEIVEREKGQKLPGSLAIQIDGQDAFYTCNPLQFMPKSLKKALEAGATPETAPAVAAKICEQYARASLNRVIADLMSGKRNPGGGLLTRGSDAINDFAARAVAGLTAKEKSSAPKGSETKAVEAFLNRGKHRGVSPERRAEMLKVREALNEQELDQRRLRARAQRFTEQIEATKKELSDPATTGGKRERLEKRLAELEGLLKETQSSVRNASHGFQYAYGQYLTKQVDLVNDDIRVLLLMTNTTVDTERDAKDAYSDFTTPDNFDGSGYTTNGHALDTQAVNIDDSNDRAEFDAADETITSLGAGTRSVQGILVISFISTLNGSLPLHWIEFASNKTPDGSDFTLVFNAEGIIQAADG